MDKENSNHSEDSVRSLAASLTSSGNQSKMLGVLEACSTSPNPLLAAAVLSELGKSPPAIPRNALACLAALRPILNSDNKSLATAALSLAAAWDKPGILSKEITRVAGELMMVARDPKQKESNRIHAIRVLLSARSVNPYLLPNIIKLLAIPQSDALGKELVVSLAATGEISAGQAIVDVYPTLPGSQQETAFGALVIRPEYSKLFMDSVKSGKIVAASLAPGQISRLTSHPDHETAKRAQSIFSSTGGAQTSDKNEIIARLLPQVEKPGDVAKGKVMFTAACSSCHQLDGAGHVFGPDLGGIGSHPVMELLTHIVNPNLVVDDEHRTWNITLKNGTQYSALIASENEARVQIRQPGGTTLDLKPDDIASRVKGNNSLMPEGLEAIGVDNLRDIISYIRSCAPLPSNQ